MQKETLMETSVPVETSVSIEQAGTVSHGESPTPGGRVKTAVSVGNPFAACVKIVTRLDALKEYVLGYMDTERYRVANPAESRPNDAPVVLDEAEQALGDLRRIAGRAGLENAIAERELAASDRKSVV